MNMKKVMETLRTSELSICDDFKNFTIQAKSLAPHKEDFLAIHIKS